jgi:hypothetical protein
METALMTPLNNVREIASKKEMTFQQFAGQCLLRGLSYDTASRVWNKEATARGFNTTTKAIVSEILGRPVKDVFGE